MATIQIRDTEPEFSVERDEQGDVILTLYADGQTITLNTGGSQDDAGNLSRQLSRAGDQVDDILEDWQDMPDPYRDGFISIDGRRGAWFVSLEGNARGDQKHGYPSEQIAAYELARAMADDGAFPNAWAEGEHGPTTRDINDQIRAFHDEGGDKLRTLPGAIYQPGDVVIASDEEWRTWVVAGDYGDVPAGGLGIMLHTLGDPDVTMFRETHDNLTRDPDDTDN